MAMMYVGLSGTKATLPEDSKPDRAAARKVGVNLIQYRILKALAKASSDGLSYGGIEMKTGYYSVQSWNLRGQRPPKMGLVAMGLVEETQLICNGRACLFFIITPRGRKALESAKA